MIRGWVHALRRATSPFWLGIFRNPTPVSDHWGFDRGTPIDRRYIEEFLADHRGAIRGRVLEVQDSIYARRFGHGTATAIDVLDIDPENPRATVIADLTDARQVPAASYDCAVITQTLHLIRDVPAAIGHLHRMLAPGGTLLATLPALSRISAHAGVDHDHWRFTVASATWMFGEAFGPSRVVVRSRGNVLGGIAFLAGLAAEELPGAQLAADDPFFPVVITVCATKGEG